MTDTKVDPWALLREARVSVERDFDWGEHDAAGRQPLLALLKRIDAALAAHEAEAPDSATAVVEWWSASQQEATLSDGFLRVWCAGPHAWRWTAWSPESFYKSGTATTENEAKSAAIAAARGMR